MLEFRADGFDPATVVDHYLQIRHAFEKKMLKSIAWIFTIRLERDGGLWKDAEANARLFVWEALIRKQAVEWLDIEVEEVQKNSALIDSLRQIGAIKFLISQHCFDRGFSPAEYQQVLQAMLQTKPEGIKFAVHCQNEAQRIQLYHFAQTFLKGYPKILSENSSIFSMGALGQASRFLMPLMGIALTYGFFGNRQVAPGQLSVRNLHKLLLFTPTNIDYSLSITQWEIEAQKIWKGSLES